jgi:hypothetical protein
MHPKFACVAGWRPAADLQSNAIRFLLHELCRHLVEQSWGSQSWLQPSFQAARPARKLVGGQNCPPHNGHQPLEKRVALHWPSASTTDRG